MRFLSISYKSYSYLAKQVIFYCEDHQNTQSDYSLTLARLIELNFQRDSYL
jgi:hypothetical protein